MKKFILVSEKSWNKDAVEFLKQKIQAEWILIDAKEKFTIDILKEYNPDKIFIPHWSYIIPEEIYSNFECVVFHMTDLPFGRGGSPLQNLIVRKIYETKISALKVSKGIDAGPIYLKEPLSLWGNAEEIFIRANAVIVDMIVSIIQQNIVPQEQVGEIVEFKRRTPDQSNIMNLETEEEIYNYIRMLDAPGYPHAFIEIKNFRLEFSKAKLTADNIIEANVRIFKK